METVVPNSRILPVDVCFRLINLRPDIKAGFEVEVAVFMPQVSLQNMSAQRQTSKFPKEH